MHAVACFQVDLLLRSFIYVNIQYLWDISISKVSEM